MLGISLSSKLCLKWFSHKKCSTLIGNSIYLHLLPRGALEMANRKVSRSFCFVLCIPVRSISPLSQRYLFKPLVVRGSISIIQKTFLPTRVSKPSKSNNYLFSRIYKKLCEECGPPFVSGLLLTVLHLTHSTV